MNLSHNIGVMYSPHRSTSASTLQHIDHLYSRCSKVNEKNLRTTDRKGTNQVHSGDDMVSCLFSLKGGCNNKLNI